MQRYFRKSLFLADHRTAIAICEVRSTFEWLSLFRYVTFFNF